MTAYATQCSPFRKVNLARERGRGSAKNIAPAEDSALTTSDPVSSNVSGPLGVSVLSSDGIDLTMFLLRASYSRLSGRPLFSWRRSSVETAPEVAGNQAIDAGKRRILVVEDHEDTLRSMKLLLRRLGYEVLAAENMTDALQIAEEEQFDILLSDIGLPDGSGLELLKRIRQMRDVPALALSGFGMDEDVERSRDAGFSDHLTKPVSIDRLQAAIARLG